MATLVARRVACDEANLNYKERAYQVSPSRPLFFAYIIQSPQQRRMQG